MTKLQSLYYSMLRIRRVEQEIARRYPEQQMRCPVHLSIGQEATAVGIAALLNKDDLMVGTHRSHAFYLAKGGSLRGLICELYGKADGCSRGQGGSMHLVDLNCGFQCSTSIVGGTIPVGVGLAWAQKIRGLPGIVVVCLGDAAIEEGVFHESANFASLHGLPVVFACENNFYSCYTHIRDRQPKRSFYDVAKAHGMDYIGVNGNDVSHIIGWGSGYIHDVRTRKKPLFMEMKTYRHLQHCGPSNDDDLGYRDPAEVEEWMKKDPITITEHQLHASKEWTEEFIESFALIDEEIRLEFDHAMKAPFPDQSELGKFEYAHN